MRRDRGIAWRRRSPTLRRFFLLLLIASVVVVGYLPFRLIGSARIHGGPDFEAGYIIWMIFSASVIGLAAVVLQLSEYSSTRTARGVGLAVGLVVVIILVVIRMAISLPW